MDMRSASPGFALSPASLTPATSSFHGTALSPLLWKTPQLARRTGRACVVAIGGAPAPPPKEPEEDAEGTEPAAGEPVEPTEPIEEVTADDILSSPAFLKKKLEIVQKELIEAKAALEQDSEAVTTEKEKYVRLAADFENYRRRSAADIRKQDAKSTAKVCKEILTVLDNFERAIESVDAQTEKEKSINSSYQTINKQLLEALVKLKVEPIDAIGETFDPELHEAIQKMESAEYAEDTVCAQFQRGYKIGETLIRAAVVGVSEGPGPEVANGDAPEEPDALDVEAAVAGADSNGDKSAAQ